MEDKDGITDTDYTTVKSFIEEAASKGLIWLNKNTMGLSYKSVYGGNCGKLVRLSLLSTPTLIFTGKDRSLPIQEVQLSLYSSRLHLDRKYY
jgi:hypothetical protein